MNTRTKRHHIALGILATIISAKTSLADAVANDFVMPKIVGGTTAPKGKYPFMVYIEATDDTGETSTCGGSLIDANSVLTAAHCITDKQEGGGFIAYQPANIKVWVKAWNTENLEDAKARGVKSLYVHDNYNDGSAYGAYDVAVLNLDKRVPGVQKLELPKGNQNARIDDSGKMAIVAGWGDTVEDGSGSTLLKKLKYEVVDDTDCKDNYATLNLKVDESIQMCAYTPGGGFCNGDSGGPLFRHMDGDDVQIGVVSWSQGCARENLPDVYVRLTNPSINSFIKKSMKH